VRHAVACEHVGEALRSVIFAMASLTSQQEVANTNNARPTYTAMTAWRTIFGAGGRYVGKMSRNLAVAQLERVVAGPADAEEVDS